MVPTAAVIEGEMERASGRWRQGMHHLDLGKRLVSGGARKDWDGFYSDRDTWLECRGGYGDQRLQLLASASSPCSSSHTPLLGTELVLSADPWEHTGECIEEVKQWISEAARLRAIAAGSGARLRHEQRAGLLRRGDLKGWARHFRPAQSPCKKYAPSKLRTEQGTVRPSSPDQMRRAAAQEWQVLFTQPPTPWSHDAILQWVDAAGRLRGSPRTAGVGEHKVSACVAVLRPGPWVWQQWRGVEVRHVSESELCVGGWRLWRVGQQWMAQTVGPCPGAVYFLVHVDGMPPGAWCPDRWASLPSNSRHEWLLVKLSLPLGNGLVAPLSARERAHWLGKMKASRPGPSGWKIYYLHFFPEWVQDIFWTMLDVQRCRGMLAPAIKQATQVNLSKPKGGWRPLSMLEEEFKAIEGPVTQRCSLARSLAPPGDMYSSHNLAYERGEPAAVDVLYLDVLVVEDARRSGRPLARVPVDYEKFFNAINLPQVDAVMQARGVPDLARRLYQEAFQGLQIRVETPWGLSDVVECRRGVPQGATSSPELSKPAQDPLLRLRESSTACYVSSAGRRVVLAGFVDDTEHYAQGVRQLHPLLKDLRAGSLLTGAGFAWDKFSVFCTDWDELIGTAEGDAIGLTVDGVQAAGFDIWTGGVRDGIVPRLREEDVEKLLGKRGCFLDRHTLAAEDLAEKLDRLRTSLASRRYNWDELLVAVQIFVCSHINYASLVGVPAPVIMHRRDAAVQQLMLRALHVRSTAERVGLLAPRRVGGLQLASAVECLLGALADELIRLLTSPRLVGKLARDSLREAMACEPPHAALFDGMIPRAMHHLAGYGIFVTASMDRMVGRVLDALFRMQGVQSAGLVGPFDERCHAAAARFCRVGPLANAVRATVRTLQSDDIPIEAWDLPELWVSVAEVGVSPAECAAAAGEAVIQMRQDWATECGLAQVECADILEDWAPSAWEEPDSIGADPRSRHLDSTLHGLAGLDMGLFADGGADAATCTFAGQARSFGVDDRYWEESHSVMPQLRGRLPRRWGWEDTTIHTAEFFAMLVALRWRRLNAWNLLVVDRSALFPVLRACVENGSVGLRKYSCLPLMARLRGVLEEMKDHWSGTARKPVWRRDQETNPARWEITRPREDGGAYSLCHIAFCRFGLVGVDIRSHQTEEEGTARVLVAGNQSQDEGCARARSEQLPKDVWWPTGGLAFQLVYQGRAVTAPARKFMRLLLRREAWDKWKLRTVQGKCSFTSGLFHPGLDLRLYVSFSVPERWKRWLLEGDGHELDLSAFAYRCFRAIGGSWTERLHADPQLLLIGEAWAARSGNHVRTCPLCGDRAGTPRHVIMSCSAMQPLVEALRDDMEAELSRVATRARLVEAAAAARLSSHGGTYPTSQRWPVLSAWRWLVPSSSEIEVFGAEVNGSSRETTRLEHGHDLAYRGIMPQELGRALKRLAGEESANVSSVLDDDDEQFGSSVCINAAAEEHKSSLSHLDVHVGAAAGPLRLLVMGLRAVRAEYLKRIQVWSEAVHAALHTAVDPVAAPPPAVATDGFVLWLASATGRECVRELRWLGPTRRVAVQRVRQEYRAGLSDNRVVRQLSASGVPFLDQDDLCWNVCDHPWGVCRAALQRVCQCVRVHPMPQLACCSTCGGLQIAEVRPALPCPWCRQLGELTCAACSVSIHYRGGCSWNRGAHASYRIRAEEAIQLCPDCHWVWVQACSAIPLGHHRPAPTDVRDHMTGLADRCLPGAGICSARVVQGMRQRLERFFRRWSGTEWRRVGDAARSFRDLCQPRVLNAEGLLDDVNRVVDSLVQRRILESRGLGMERAFKRRMD